MRHFFTSESVTEGHPDKLCDQISDAILDAILEKDPDAHVACECAATTGMVLVMGEITTSAYVPIDQIAREKIVEIGYDRAKYGFDGHSCAVLVSLDEQSPDIGARRQPRNRHGAGRGRSGHDVRLCLRRNAGVYAAGDLAGAQAFAAAGGGSQGRHAALPAAGRQIAGDRRVRRRPPGARRRRGRLDAARARRRAGQDLRGRPRARRPPRAAREPRRRGTRSTTSTRPGASSSAARRATPA